MTQEERATAWKTAAKVGAATLAWAALHSLLASRCAKRTAARVLGERQRNGVYRVFFNTQAIATLGGLGWYVLRLPDEELYSVRGPASGLMRLGQVAALGYMGWAAWEVGLGGMSGFSSLAALLRGEPVVPPEPEAQGPALDEDGQLRVAGPFRWSRHPLNFAPVPLLWLNPTMTARLAGFSTVATVYFIVGSLHEESLNRERYCDVYEAYQESGCPFFLPARPSVNDMDVTPYR